MCSRALIICMWANSFSHAKFALLYFHLGALVTKGLFTWKGECPANLVTRLTEEAFTQVHAIDIVTCLLGVPCLFAKASGKDLFLYCKWVDPRRGYLANQSEKTAEAELCSEVYRSRSTSSQTEVLPNWLVDQNSKEEVEELPIKTELLRLISCLLYTVWPFALVLRASNNPVIIIGLLALRKNNALQLTNQSTCYIGHE